MLATAPSLSELVGDIDDFLASLGPRENISTTEVANRLLDLRNKLTNERQLDTEAVKV